MRQPTTDQHQSSTSTSPLSIVAKPSPPSFNYVDLDSISDELICPICSLPFVDPVVHNPPSSECGNTFCRSCIQSCPSCPFCRRGDETNVFQLECSSAPKIISKQLEKLKVICSMCKNVVCRGEYKDHQEKHCPLLEAYAPVEALKVELAKLNADRLEQEKVKLENDYNKLKQDLEKERQRLNAEIDLKKQDLQKKDQELQQEFSSRFRTEMSQRPLHLNVGGKFMSVSISDFMNREREPESLFLKMLSGEHPFYESKIFSLENHPVRSELVASSSPASIAIHQEQMDGEFKNHHHSTGTTKASSTSTTTSWNNTTMMSTQPRSTIFGGFNLGLNISKHSSNLFHFKNNVME